MTKKQKIFRGFLFAFLVALFARTFLIEGFYVKGDSMYPTIKNGQYIFINKTSFWFRDPTRGEVIVAYPRAYPGRVIKRIIGMPGERLSIEDKKIVIRYNRTDVGEKLDESNIGNVATPEVGITKIIISPKEYFAMGDNRAVSIDSRELGAIDEWDIKGKVFLIFDFKNFKFSHI